jgi:uncharacterized membrane protein
VSQNRDLTIDILRGFAVFTMIGANMGPVLNISEVPFWFRLYGSFAAPLFILISGMMVGLTSQTKRHGLSYFLVRGVMILVVGAFIDMFIWGIVPFTTVDVLYLIGISLPIVYLSRRLGIKSRWIIVALIFLFTPVLQNILGYTNYPTELSVLGRPTIIPSNPTGIPIHWIVDGWFPIFPWLGLSLLGANIADLRLRLKSFTSRRFLLGGIAVMGSGILAWWFYPGQLMTRAGYFELFYPPTIGYILVAIGLIVVLFSLVDRQPSLVLYKPLRVLGEAALFVYILHLALIRYIIELVYSELDFLTFLLVYIVTTSFIITLAYGLRLLRIKLE